MLVWLYRALLTDFASFKPVLLPEVMQSIHANNLAVDLLFDRTIRLISTSSLTRPGDGRVTLHRKDFMIQMLSLRSRSWWEASRMVRVQGIERMKVEL